LSADEYGVLGEYFMGQMMGDAHAAMNAMMIQMMGEEGEEQMHEVMGRRLSGCDTAAAFPAGGVGWMPMMQMMWGGWSAPGGFNFLNTMMNFGYGFGFFGWIMMLLWWALVIVALVVLMRWLMSRSRGTTGGGSALDTLKERYAKGEISRKEFEEMKQTIS
jgi:putative membrane protein